MSTKDQRRRARVQGGWAVQQQSEKLTTLPSLQSGPNQKTFIFKTPEKMATGGLSAPNFSWVEPGLLAGLAFPSQPAHLHFLVAQGIHVLVSLTQRKPKMYDIQGLRHVHIPMEDFTPPTIDQVNKFLDLTFEAKKNNQGVAVHCAHGNGRTGTMLACYLVLTKNMSGAEAIREIRRLRPGAIETTGQERLVEQYANYLKNNPTS